MEEVLRRSATPRRQASAVSAEMRSVIRRGFGLAAALSPPPLRGGVGVGGGGSNSDVRACARRPYNAWFAATALYACAPTPLGLSAELRALPAREGTRRRFETLVRADALIRLAPAPLPAPEKKRRAPDGGSGTPPCAERRRTGRRRQMRAGNPGRHALRAGRAGARAALRAHARSRPARIGARARAGRASEQQPLAGPAASRAGSRNVERAPVRR